jgi:hypothetical protein
VNAVTKTNMHRRTFITSLLSGLLCLLHAWADSPSNRFAGQIQQYREAAAAARGLRVTLMDEVRRIPVFSKVDGPLITAHLEAVGAFALSGRAGHPQAATW